MASGLDVLAEKTEPPNLGVAGNEKLSGVPDLEEFTSWGTAREA